jgi:hypothetical protein
VKLYGTRKGAWLKVAKHVGDGLDGKQVNRRWRAYLDPAICDMAKEGRGTKWTPEEDARLLQFVAEREGKSKPGSIDWTGVESFVGRVHAACRVRLRDLRERHMKRGPFTPEEVRTFFIKVSANSIRSVVPYFTSGVIVRYYLPLTSV